MCHYSRIIVTQETVPRLLLQQRMLCDSNLVRCGGPSRPTLQTTLILSSCRGSIVRPAGHTDIVLFHFNVYKASRSRLGPCVASRRVAHFSRAYVDIIFIRSRVDRIHVKNSIRRRRARNSAGHCTPLRVQNL